MIETDRCVLRGWQREDRRDLADIANNRAIWRNLAHPFPHPYTVGDATAWIAQASRHEPNRHLAITVEGVLAGGIGAEPLRGERSGCATFGYWLGEPFWGTGLATECAAAYLGWFVATFQPRRVEATVFAWNPASARVLEKVGFELEGRRIQAIQKGDDVTDDLLYGMLT